MLKMVKAQRVTAVLFVLLGLYVIIYSAVGLEVGTINKPASGFFTLICGLGIFILSLLWGIAGLREKEKKAPLWETRQWLRPLLAVAVTFVYAVLMDSLGYVLSTAIFIILWQIVIAKGKKLTIILFAVLGTAAMYTVFELLLSVPLPNGLLRF
jgi:putative tricarboxylic transport membrane protein